MRALRLPLLAVMLALLPASAPGYPGAAEVLAELNRLRTDPTGYAAGLEDYRRLFGTPDSRTYTLPGETLARLSIDGAPAVVEAIAALNRPDTAAHAASPPATGSGPGAATSMSWKRSAMASTVPRESCAN